jgi:Ran-binding protein 9/10
MHVTALDGHPLQPKLELVYRQTALCLRQLAYLGVGAAAFADVRRELIESNRAERLQ